jgi:hypothetical protein
VASVRKEFKKLLQEAEKQGWGVKPVKNGVQLLAPDGIHIVTVHGTPGDWRAFHNTLSDMRKYGFVWEGR